MILTQTAALVTDAYRELSSKKLFWITLMISGLVVAGFAAIGINEAGVTLLWFNIGDFGGFVTSATLPPDKLYKTMFIGFGVKFWLAWLASILALVSTAGMIPDFIASGAVELTLSKPVTRVRLFLTKYVLGLLFVALQVLIFASACFLVLGIRGGAWEPGVFLAIPLVVLFFSYLFSLCTLLGLLTRSTIAALLLTLLCWLFFFSLNATDQIVLQGRETTILSIEKLQAGIERAEKSKARGDRSPEQLAELDRQIADRGAKIAEAHGPLRKWEKAARAVYLGKTIFPKTSETTDLLRRVLDDRMNLSEQDEADNGPDATVSFGTPMSPADTMRIADRLDAVLKKRSIGWVLGTSLAFEAFILALACWIFARRDF